MKAYMSDPHEHLYPGELCSRLQSVDGGRADYQQAAESEARRILAETEPQEHPCSHAAIYNADRGRYGLAKVCYHCAAWSGRALAESLARFISLPIE